MNADPMTIAIVAVVGGFFALFLIGLFFYLRLWIQALLSNAPLSFFDILGMRLRRSPARLIVNAMIVLGLRGVKVSAREAETYYLVARDRGEPVATATELADLIERIKRAAPDPPHT
jgi:uncharacterized protein YqfA (UPF0365 family)